MTYASWLYSVAMLFHSRGITWHGPLCKRVNNNDRKPQNKPHRRPCPIINTSYIKISHTTSEELVLTLTADYYTLCLKKTRQLWNGITQNCKDQFWWHLAEIFKILQNRVCMLQFSCRFAFLSTFQSFKPDTENNANFESYASHCLSTWHHSVKKTKFGSKVCMIVHFKAPGSL